MTVDELRNLYNRAFSRVPEASGLLAQQNAGIRAVVRALRDDCRSRGDFSWRDFDEILGDAGEKAAGGPTSNDGPGVIAPLASPADPSPAVCEWTRAPRRPNGVIGRWLRGCNPKAYQPLRYASDDCPSCGKPIAFKGA